MCKKNIYDKIDKLEIQLEHILERDPRIFLKPYHESGQYFDRIADIYKQVRDIKADLIKLR